MTKLRFTCNACGRQNETGLIDGKCPDGCAATDKLRKAPVGAKPPVQPAPPRYIDITPTWRGLLPLYLAARESGSFNAIKEAETELARMADLADLYVKLAKYSPETVRQLLDQIKSSGQS